MKFKPMSACEVKLDDVKFPCFISPKIDGCRCIIIDGIAYSRTLKPFPNKQFQKRIQTLQRNNLDCEVYVGSPSDGKTFERTQAYLMTIEATSEEVNLFTIDDITRTNGYNCPTDYFCLNKKDLISIEAKIVGQGYEGIIIRYPDTKYKNGRSTTKEGCLMKYKRFKDGEAVVIDCHCLVNKDGIVQNKLGAFKVRDLITNNEFRIGTGFTDIQRREFWANLPIGEIIKYKYQELSKYGIPRFPVFLGFRDIIDIGDN